MNNLKKTLDEKPSLKICGAFDGLTARLIEQNGFDAVWASGFSISASKCIPDSNVLSAEELLNRVDEMLNSISIPIIVDCDEGYGTLSNSLRLVKRLINRGVQGICIEDNIYPKSNSFMVNVEHNLVKEKDFCKKISSIKCNVPETLLIARTETLIVNELMLEEAIQRGTSYAKSGADLILIHSKYKELYSFKTLIRSWTDETPLVVIPTLAPQISFDSLSKLGFKMVIYSNQILRASIYAIKNTLHSLGNNNVQIPMTDNEIVSMDEIFELTKLNWKI